MYGVWTLLPITVVIVFALKTKRNMEALILGAFISYIIISGPNFLSSWTDAFFRVASDRDNQWIFMVCGLFGSLIALLGASHGVLGFSDKMERFCRGPKSTMFITWLLGVIIFVDDYLNIMTLSTCMKKLTDKKRVPREALSYIIDSTGAPVCTILPFSTWAIFFAGLFYSQKEILALGYGSPMATFYHVIPFAFYSIAAVIIVPLFIFGIVPKMGLMKKAYQRTEQGGKPYSDESTELNREEEDEDAEAGLSGNLWDFVIPVAILIAVAIVGGDLFNGVIIAIAVCMVMYLPRKKMSFSRFCDLFIHGFCNMVPTLGIIFSAFVMQQAMADIHIAEYIISAVEPYANPIVFPAIAFLVVTVLSFSTGSSWGLPAIAIPIIIPLGASVGANPLLVMGAIVSGAAMGSNACFYSDATVLTSTCCKMQNMDHALSQLPYALITAGIAAVSYLSFGAVMQTLG